MMLYRLIIGEIKRILTDNPEGLFERDIAFRVITNQDIDHTAAVLSNNIEDLTYDPLTLQNTKSTREITRAILSTGVEQKDKNTFLPIGWLKRTHSGIYALSQVSK